MQSIIEPYSTAFAKASFSTKNRYKKAQRVPSIWTEVALKTHLGPDITQSNRNIRRLLHLAQASKKDVFYDLGCGRGQLCIIAVSEFGVRHAVGIERLKSRAKKAEQRVRHLGLSRQIEIRNEDFYDSDLYEATIAYNGLMEDFESLQFYEQSLKRECRLVTLSMPLVGVMLNSQDYPFYLMKIPFRKARSVSQWVQTVLSQKMPVKDFFKEIAEDPDYWTDIRTLKALIRRRFR
ncbi:methyltransferase domain-containing protein [Candidatus Bathyarchaeota archaeon]|nr:MAG: methyltransferase domain-containing protein [Candidatus Bathyarchaeota archaeon]